MNPSADYERALERTKHHHATRKSFSGRYMPRYLSDIEALVRELDCKTMLDYGCGKGIQYEGEISPGKNIQQHLKLDRIALYDPGVPDFAQEPTGKYDIVICTQALGSIPTIDLPWVVDRLMSLATKAVYIGERLRPVRKQTHADMADRMPRDWFHRDWAGLVNDRYRPGSGLVAQLRTKDDQRVEPQDNLSTWR